MTCSIEPQTTRNPQNFDTDSIQPQTTQGKNFYANCTNWREATAWRPIIAHGFNRGFRLTSAAAEGEVETRRSGIDADTFPAQTCNGMATRKKNSRKEIHAMRGSLKMTPGDKPFVEWMADLNREEKELEERKFQRLVALGKK
jgi:hypothetical protein